MSRLIARLAQLTVLLLGALCAELAPAQAPPPTPGPAYPHQAIRVIVPFLRASALDDVMRSLTERVSGAIGQTVFVENHFGATTIAALEACAKAPPDGYTVCVASGEGMSFNPTVFRQLPYDPDKDFVPITNLAWINGVIVASGGMPFDTVKGMTAYVKGKPGGLSWGSFGPMSDSLVYLEWIKHQTGAEISHVRYKRSWQIVRALLNSEIQVTYAGLPQVLQHVKTGRLKPLAATGAKRLAQLANVPTLLEQGLDPGFREWFGLVAPAKTPRPIVERLNAEFAKAVREPRFQDEFLTVNGLVAIGDSP